MENIKISYFYTIRVKAHEYVIVKEPVINGLYKAGVANFYMFRNPVSAEEYIKQRKDYDPEKNIVIYKKKYDDEINKIRGEKNNGKK